MATMVDKERGSISVKEGKNFNDEDTVDKLVVGKIWLHPFAFG